MEWHFPDWMKKYLEYLPSCTYCSRTETEEERIALIEKYKNLRPEDAKTFDDEGLALLVHNQVTLLELLYRKGHLK